MLGEISDNTLVEVNTFKSKTTHFDQNGVSFGVGPIALLDMLAEVASQTLHSDPSVSFSPPSKENQVRGKSFGLPQEATGEIKSNKKCNNVKRKLNPHKPAAKRKKSITQGNKECGSATDISSLSANSLIKLFSKFDGNEMRRTFKFMCTFDAAHCQQQYSSFGNEDKARQRMKDHLLQHVANKDKGLSELTTSSNWKINDDNKELFDKRDIKRKRRSKNVTWMESLTEGNVQHSIQTLEYTECGNEINNNTKQETPQQKLEKPEGDMIERHVVDDQTYAGIEDELQEICIPNILPMRQEEEVNVYNEHNYIKQKNHFTGGENLESFKDEINEEACMNKSQNVSAKDELNESAGDIQDDCVVLGSPCKGDTAYRNVEDVEHGMENEEECLSWLPPIGQEVDVRTTQPPSGKLSVNGKTEQSIDNTYLNQDNAYLCEEGYSKLKKSKGNSKLLGQSEAEKNLAIHLIESIKFKGLHPESLECNICTPTRFFTALTTLISHYRSHAGIKPYECRLCGHVFTRQHSLNYHLLIHGNVTRFECTDCGRKFRHPSHFREHRRRHTGEAPYECSDCPLRFKTRNTYKRHLKTRHGKLLTTSGGISQPGDSEVVGQSHTSVNQESGSGGDDSSHDDDCNSSPLDMDVSTPPSDDLDKENTVDNSKNFTRNKCLHSTGEAFHDIVEEAMRQSDISFNMESNSGSSSDVGITSVNCDSLRQVSVNETQQNIAANTLYVTKTEQKYGPDLSKNTVEAMLKVPVLLSKVNSKPELDQLHSEFPLVYNSSVNVNVSPILPGNISYERNILPATKLSSLSTELRIIYPNTPATAIMLVTGNSNTYGNGYDVGN